MLTGRNQVVAGALGAGRSQDRSGDLQEIVSRHSLTESGHHVAAKNDVVLHLGITQIQIAVLQTLYLIGLTAAVDLKGQAVMTAAAQNLDRLGNHFDLTGGEIGVLGGTLSDRTGYGNGGLLIQIGDDRHHLFGLHNDLCGAVEIAQNDKRQVCGNRTNILHESHQFYLLAGIGKTQLSAGVGAHLYHNAFSLYFVFNLRILFCFLPSFCPYSAQTWRCRHHRIPRHSRRRPPSYQRDT